MNQLFPIDASIKIEKSNRSNDSQGNTQTSLIVTNRLIAPRLTTERDKQRGLLWRRTKYLGQPDKDLSQSQLYWAFKLQKMYFHEVEY